MEINSTFLAGFEGQWRRPSPHYRNAIQSYTIVIDTNVLLDLYRFTPKARHELLDVLRKVQDRLWIPHQVAKEYFDRRVGALKDQLDLYDSVPRELKTLHEKAITQVNTFARRCSLSERDKKALIEPLQAALNSVTSEIERHRSTLDLTLARVAAADDPVLESLAAILNQRTGSPFPKEDEDALLKTYLERAAARVPPGYKDSGKSENAHGDYFVWEQMIRHSSEKGTDTLFITSDVKEDWFYKAAGIAVGARPELISEMRERANTDFLMLQLSAFLRESKEALGAEVSEDTYEAAKNAAIDPAPRARRFYYSMERRVYDAIRRHLSGLVDHALEELEVAQAQDTGEPHSINRAVKTRLLQLRQESVTVAFKRLEMFDSCPYLERDDFVDLATTDQETARMIDSLLQEAEVTRHGPVNPTDGQLEKGSAVWVARLENALAPFVDTLSPRSISEDSVTFHVGDFSNVDTEAIRGLAKSFDVDIHLFAANGMAFTAWARR